MRHAILLAAVAVTVLWGHITDRTTGQPLARVHVRAGDHAAITDSSGRYILRGLAPGAYTLTLDSNDVPPEHVTVKLRRGANVRDFRACSTTLDYGCRQTPALENGG